ncbi:MAG: hypothetical protein WCU88_05815 [Elusimicrobiota bacterium]
MKIAVEADGPNAAAVVGGALRAVRNDGAEVLLFGPQAPLRAALDALGASAEKGLVIIDVPHAPEPLPGQACTVPSQSPILRAAFAVARKEADALVSTGKPSSAIAAALRHMKRLPGILRPALLCSLPSAKGTVVLLDAGADIGSKSWNLLQFSLMGALFAQRILRKDSPTVGLLAAGPEGEEQTLREALPLLKYSGLNFQGLVEGHQIPAGIVDVVVCDGLLGDVACRLAQGFLTHLAPNAPANPGAQKGGLLKRLRTAAANSDAQKTPPAPRGTEHTVLPYLGVDGAVVVCRTPEDPESIRCALRSAAALSKARLAQMLRERLQEFKNNVELSRLMEP